MKIEVINRRDLLKGLDVGGAALVAAEQAQSAKRPRNPSLKANVSTCIIARRRLSCASVGPGRAGRRAWSPEYSLEMMDKYDIGVAMLSMTQMGNLLHDNTEKGRHNVRLGNDYGAEVMANAEKLLPRFKG